MDKKKSNVKKMKLKLGTEMPDLQEVLQDITFDLVNIQLSIKKELVGLAGTGYTSVGFVNSYDVESNTFNVVVFNNHSETISKLGKVQVVCRVRTNKEGKVVKVTGFDVTPVEE